MTVYLVCAYVCDMCVYVCMLMHVCACVATYLHSKYLDTDMSK